MAADTATGAILGGKDHDLRWAPASTTKMMTALLTVEAIDAGQISLDSTVVVQADVDIEPASGDVGLAAGDRVSVRDLLNMAMLQSANDAAVALGTTGLSTTNQLLPGRTNAYTGAYGVKTGTTDMARANLVSAARDAGPDGKDVIAVVLGSDDDVATTANRYTDSTALLDWALDRP